jgi:hypothetical protein
MRVVHPAAVVLIGAALAGLCLIACNRQSYSDYPSESDASGHDSSSGRSIGGSETVVVTDTASTQVISTCNFTLGYVKQ